MRVVSEQEFRERLKQLCKLPLVDLEGDDDKPLTMVTGPGRSGAIASVYASYFLKIPFLPYKSPCPFDHGLLIIDTAAKSGRTLRKAERFYKSSNPLVIPLFIEPPRITFWYEYDN